MCGDGANDCGALKAAHTGISLSEAESSVASPFTSQIADISCVPRVIRECRAALVTSFGVFKFMVLYSITEFLSTVILYSIDSNLTPNEFLFIDMCLGLNFALSFGRNHAYSGPLVPMVPLTSVFSIIAMASMIFQVILVFSFQYLSYSVIKLFPWFTPFKYTQPTNYTCYENYAVFTLSQFQYIIIAFIYSQGAPYRAPIYSNRIFLASIICMIAVCTYITLQPAQWIIYVLELKFPAKLDFPLVVLGLAGVNFVVSVFFESFIVQYLMFNKLRHLDDSKKKSKKMYLNITNDLNSNSTWPPLTNQTLEHKQKVTSVDEKINVKSSLRQEIEKDVESEGHINPAFTYDEETGKITTKL